MLMMKRSKEETVTVDRQFEEIKSERLLGPDDFFTEKGRNWTRLSGPAGAWDHRLEY
jgi:hypothetical protein